MVVQSRAEDPCAARIGFAINLQHAVGMRRRLCEKNPSPSYRPERANGPRSGDIFLCSATVKAPRGKDLGIMHVTMRLSPAAVPIDDTVYPPLGVAPDGAKQKSGAQSRPARPRLVALDPGLNPGRHHWYSRAAKIVRRSLISTGLFAPSAGKPALHSQRYNPQRLLPFDKLGAGRSRCSVEMTKGEAPDAGAAASVDYYPGAMPFLASSPIALGVFSRWPRPMPFRI